MENEKLLVVGVKSYNFTDRNTGEILKGLNVHYLSESDNDLVQGFAVGKANLSYDLLDDYKKLNYPFYAQPVTKVEFSGNKPSIKIVDFKVLSDASITDKKIVKN
jgi:myo-inositol-1-phosphate synthase